MLAWLVVLWGGSLSIYTHQVLRQCARRGDINAMGVTNGSTLQWATVAIAQWTVGWQHDLDGQQWQQRGVTRQPAVGMQPQDMVRCIMKRIIPTSSHGHVPKCLTSLEKKITWRDALFPRQTLDYLSSSKPNLHQVWPTAE